MIGPLWPLGLRRTARVIEGHFSEILKVIEEYLSNATQLVADLSKTAKELENGFTLSHHTLCEKSSKHKRMPTVEYTGSSQLQVTRACGK